MADGLTLNAGSGGSTLATDDAGAAGHVQLVKLAVSADGSATALTADNTNGLLADVKRVQGTVTVDGSAVTQPVSAASLPLPSGAATAAKQDTGNTSLAAINIDSSAIAASASVLDDWDESDRAKVNIVAGQAGVTAGAGAVAANTPRVTLASDDPVVTAVQIMDDWDESDRAKVNVIAGQAGITAGAGAVAANTPRVTHASDDPVTTSVQLIDDAIVTDDAAFTPATTKLMIAGFQADESATDSVDEGDAGAARMTLDRKQIVTPYAHAAAGGATPYKNLDCDETEDEIKGTAGKLFWIHVINLATTKRYLKLYNDTAANVIVGTTVPVLTFPIPTHADTNGAGFAINFGDMGVQFSAAITVAATTGFADNDTGAPGANEVILNAGYL